MNNKFTINATELKSQMNSVFKYTLVYPIELILHLFNYFYIAILTTYFKIGVRPEIIVESVNFNTNIDIDYSINPDFEQDDDSVKTDSEDEE